MSITVNQDRHTPSPSHVRIKSEYVAAEDYMNEVQDLRRRNADCVEDDCRDKLSENKGTPRKEVETPEVEIERNDHEEKTALNLVHHANSRLQATASNATADRGYVHPKPNEEIRHGEEKTSPLNLVNGNSRLQMNRVTPPPPPIHLHIDPQERSRHNESPVSLSQVHTGGLTRRDSSSRDEMLDDDRYSPVPETSDCHSKSDDALTQANSEAFQPCRDRDGNLILDVDCGSNSAFLYINKLCQGSKGQSIYFNGKWFTPNEFQYISGRETAKDWKRSIRHRGKSLKILMSRGLLSVHTSAASECSNCKMNMAMTRVRYSDKRPASTSTLLTVPSSTTMSPIIDKSQHRRSVSEPESSTSQLNQIINQLHQTQTNGYSDSRKRSLILESISGNMKRSRSLSPSDDDIYEEQQRSIFQAANSPEPQIIENVRRSLNISTGGDMIGSGPPSPASLSPPSLEDQVNTGPPDGDFIVKSPQSLSKHLSKSSRKQNAPQHIDLLTTADRENSRSPHILLGTGNNSSSSNGYHKHAVSRHRFHSQVYNLSRNSSSITPNNEITNISRRTQSLVTPSAKSSDTPMIELTRPDLVTQGGNTTSASERSRVSGVTSTSQVAEDGTVTASSRLSPSDQVFFPSDMSSWMVDDVVQFVQSLKGCEEYAQFFRDQAIDGEILPVLTEDHLLQNMGMKLGPALKIRLHIAKRLGYTLNGQYCSLKTPYEEVH